MKAIGFFYPFFKVKYHCSILKISVEIVLCVLHVVFGRKSCFQYLKKNIFNIKYFKFLMMASLEK